MPCLVTSPRVLFAASALALLSVVTAAGPAAAATTYSVVATVPLGDGACPEQVQVNPTTHAVYVVDTNCGGHPVDPGAVAVIDGTTNRITGALPIGEGRTPGGTPPKIYDFALDPVRNIVYQLENNGEQAQVSVIDISTDTVTAAIPVTLDAGALADDPTTDTAFVTTGSGVAVIDGATDQITHTIPVSAGAIAVDPTTGTVFVGTGSSLAVISEATDQITATIPLSGGPAPLPLTQRRAPFLSAPVPAPSR